jgi:predicted anti-sigma-YlaC factor YlaD
MMEKTCKDIENILVDYCEGLLSREETRLVSQHLESCKNCRRLFDALERSLKLSTIIWENNLSDIEKVKIVALPKVKKIHYLRYASIAASILIIVTIAFTWSFYNKPKEIKLTFEQIERNINDSANAARLLAATELLKDYPDYKKIMENEYRYIAKTYPDTPAAERIKLKIE